MIINGGAYQTILPCNCSLCLDMIRYPMYVFCTFRTNGIFIKFDTVTSRRSIIYIKGSQVIIPKQICLFF